MKNYGLDEYCMKIVATLLDGKMQFNKLESMLEGEMATPTLSMHLKKHLVPAKFVVCKVEFEEEKLKVFYELNAGRFQNFESFKKSKEKVEKFLSKSVNDFAGLSPEEKIAHTSINMYLKSCFTLKARIIFEVSPNWQNRMLFSLLKDSPMFMEDCLVELCKKDKQFRDVVLKGLDKIIFHGQNLPIFPE